LGKKRCFWTNLVSFNHAYGYGLAHDGWNNCPRPCLRGWRPKKSGGQENQGLGRSKGGFTSKIHTASDSFGNGIDFIITGGQRHDSTQAEALLKNKKCTHILADKAYNSDKILLAIAEVGAEAVIPPKSNRKIQREYDKETYKHRSQIECFFSKLKQYRKISTRYDKLARNFLGFVILAAIHILTR
jgi:transposase